MEILEKKKKNSQEILEKLEKEINIYINELFNDIRRKKITLENVAQFKRGPFGGSLKKEIFISEGYKVYEQKNAIQNNFDIGRYFIDKSKFEEMKGFSVQPNDLIISCSGTMGKIAIAPKSIKPGIINQALLRLTPNQALIHPKYLKHILESDEIQTKYFKMINGVGISNVVSVKELKQIKIPLPSISEQLKIVSQIEKIESQISVLKGQLEHISAEKTEVLKKYL